MEPLDMELLWGVRLWQLAAATLLVFVSLLARKLVRSFFNGWLRRRTRDTAVQWDDDVVALIPAPLGFILQIVLWMATAALLTLPREPLDIRAFVYRTLLVLLAAAFVWLTYRVFDVLARSAERVAGATDTRLDDQFVPLARKALKVTITVVVVVLVLQNLEVEVTSLIASLGITGLVLALAARDTVANFFGSVIVFTDQPFQIGDWVEIGDTEGIIEEVGFRTTRIRRFDKSMVVLPNMHFTSSAIINHSKRPLRRIKHTVGLSYDTAPDQMRAFVARVKAVLEAHPGVDQEFHAVRFTEFGDSSLNVLVMAFAATTDWSEFVVVQEEILLQIMDIVEELGLEIAFPTRTVWVHQTPEAAAPPTPPHDAPGQRRPPRDEYRSLSDASS